MGWTQTDEFDERTMRRRGQPSLGRHGGPAPRWDKGPYTAERYIRSESEERAERRPERERVSSEGVCPGARDEAWYNDVAPLIICIQFFKCMLGG